eukprot:CAMPEP_0113572066 /NCGR_PEP_ID=MMETSP0015_2-20120614/25895_1 /TAXON_ID=2838 /ORGANISM="Odontella" /LENGTH=129 /DNA_ID=CAMNT_0000475071 /DNA_START=52 /DNA_END=438 /DNA_ORIENTATION=+ /assembly_acc=CAM_ASM_000160
MTTSTAQLRPFLAGAAAAYASVVLLRLAKSRLEKRGRSSAPPPTAVARQLQQQERLMDSPTLDLRMIRKAEGAIRLRTSRLAIVIERCTNDHNYSAILRTAEALGVHRVYIVAPPRVKTVEGAAIPSGE